MDNKLTLRFDIYQGAKFVGSERFTQDVIKIGRLSSSHLKLDDDGIARMHAIVEVAGADEVSLVDLGGVFGTNVNGEKVAKKRALQTGDTIELGSTALVVHIGEAAVAAAEAAEQTGRMIPPKGKMGEQIQASQSRSSAPAAATQSNLPMGEVQQYYENRRQAEVAAMIAAARDVVVEDQTGAEAVEVIFMLGDTVMDVTHLSQQRDLTLGEKAGCDYHVPTEALGHDVFPLVRSVGNRFALVFTSAMEGVLMVEEGKTLTFAQLLESGRAVPAPGLSGAYQVLLSLGNRGRVVTSGVTFLVSAVTRPASVLPAPTKSMSSTDLGYMGVSFLLHALFMLLAFLIPPEFSDFRLDQIDSSNRFVQFIVRPERMEEEKKPDWFKDLGKKGEKVAEAAKDESGKLGKKDAPEEKAKVAVKGDQKDLELRRRELEDQVRQEGLLKALDANQLSAPWGRSDQSVGSDAVHALGNVLDGAPPGTGHGFGGLGVFGTGPGGGGTGERSIGLGRGVGTHGIAGGKSPGFGSGREQLEGRATKRPVFTPQNPDISGSLSREIIQRVINQNRDPIRYCYEVELQKFPDLEGRIVVLFVIGPNGAVLSAEVVETQLGHQATEMCITQRILRWKFPAPKGGGLVEVRYPFLFRTSN